MNMKRLSGFTIIELMIVVVVLGVLMGIAVPSFMEMIKNNRITTNANEFATACSLARIEAVKRGTGTVIVANAGGGTSNEWGKGFTVSVWNDTSTNPGVVDASEIGVTLRQVQPFNDEVQLDSTTNDVSTISFLNTGAYNAASAETFTLCDSRTGETGRQFTLGLTGRLVLDREYTCP